MAKTKLKPVIVSAPIKLDLGCGSHKKEGFTGVDRRAMPGVDLVHDLMKKWPWGNDTVEEINMSHCLEHFTGTERVFIFNEAFRVLQKGAKFMITTPHWSSTRAYGDFTHQWPPVCEMLYQYTNKEWRMANAPDTDVSWNKEGYTCDFDFAGGYAMHPLLNARSQDYQQYAMTFYKEACQDLIMTLVKR
jgi:hypothetical protein